MTFQPRSLIQVHYHDRLSGVNKVIGLYAEAFGRIAGNNAGANLMVCSKSPKPHADFSPAGIVSVPFCDYRDFNTKRQFERVKVSLVGSLEKALKDPKVKTPVALIGHNLSMGKNCALSAAFAEVARRHLGQEDAVRFYSVLHDFAEEGRGDCLAQIDKVRKWTDIESDLFPTDGSVQFITLNTVNASILENAGFPATVLHNPVEGPMVTLKNRPLSLSKGAVLSKVRSLRKAQGTYLKRDLPEILYPSRCISRKNILEAILLCNFVYKSNLMIGASGTNAQDRMAFDKAVALCKKYRLPVMFDYGRILSDISEKGVFTNKAFDIADACVTTSIAEGFGYGLYEPWVYGKAVFGRKYLGFEPIAGVKFEGLYDRLPIPVKWISVSELRQKYWETMHKCFGQVGNIPLLSHRKRFDKAFAEYFVKNEAIDFGCLDVGAQFKIVESLLKSPGKIVDWELSCGDQLSAIRKGADIALYKSEKTIRYNQGRIERHLSLDGFSREFRKVLSVDRSPEISSNAYRDEILRQFCSFERFRLLLAK